MFPHEILGDIGVEKHDKRYRLQFVRGDRLVNAVGRKPESQPTFRDRKSHLALNSILGNTFFQSAQSLVCQFTDPIGWMFRTTAAERESRVDVGQHSNGATKVVAAKSNRAAACLSRLAISSA